jgi:hypothetical protein
MSEMEEWRAYVVELRHVAEQAVDADLQQKLFNLADRWEEFANELERADVAEIVAS